MIGKDLCVEDIKLFNPHHIEVLFGGEYSIVMLRAELAWEDSLAGGVGGAERRRYDHARLAIL